MAEEGQNNLGLASTDAVDDETCQTFIMHKEDHTLGNALRYMIMKNPDVEFCGYGVPHPFENKINLRIQTKGPPATQVLSRGLTDLSLACEYILKTFEESVSNYRQRHRGSLEIE